MIGKLASSSTMQSALHKKKIIREHFWNVDIDIESASSGELLNHKLSQSFSISSEYLEQLVISHETNRCLCLFMRS